MSYTLEMLPKARGQLARFPIDWQDTLLDRVDELALQPRPPEAKDTFGEPDIYRLPVRVRSEHHERAGGVIEVLYRVYGTRALVQIRRLTHYPL